jgi:predicted transcriptional regulator
MSTAKEEVRQLLDRVPDDASLEDIQYHIYVCQKVDRGREAADQGRVLTQDEVERRMARWLEQ